MKIQGLPVLASLLLACLVAAPAAARITPYVRVDAGANKLRMSNADDIIAGNEAAFRAAGFDATFDKIGAGYGPSGSVGLWLLPGFRVGLAGSYLRSIRHHRLHVPGELFYAHDADFRMTEFGVEAAVRFQRLAGLTVGADVMQGRAEMVEGMTIEDLSGTYYLDDAARKTRTTFGGFVGLDQTAPNGVVGYVRAGFQYRDMAHMPDSFTVSDGVNTDWGTTDTTWLDYSGLYVKVGIGYDLVRK